MHARVPVDDDPSRVIQTSPIPAARYQPQSRVKESVFMAEVSDPGVSAEQAARQARRLGFWARIVLVPVAAIGAVLSFRSLYQAAVPTFGDYLAFGFPLLVDLLILGASLQYVAGAKIGRPMAGWRLTAHAGVGATLVLNALAAKELGEVPWHITAPAVWAVLVELTAKQVLGEWKATHTAKADKISFPLWMTAPIESTRTRLLMLRTGVVNAHQARIGVGVNAAAREALRLALPKRNARRVRKIINRQLRAGSLTPEAILRPLGWTNGGTVLNNARPDVILQAVLQEILDPGSAPAPIVSAPPATGPAGAVPPAQPVGSPREQFPTEPAQQPPVVVPAGAVPHPGPVASPVPVPQFQAPQYQTNPQYQQFQASAPTEAVPQYETASSYPAAQRYPAAQQYPTGPQYAATQQYAGPQQYEGPAPYEVVPQFAAARQPEVAPQYEASPAQAPGTQTSPVGAAPRPGQVQHPDRALQLGRALHRTRVLQQSGSTDSSTTTAEQLRMELARSQGSGGPRVEPPTDEEVELFETAQERARYERPMAESRSRSSEADRFDEIEILEDTEHLDELDGQGYPGDFDGIERNDYLDLDNPSRSNGSASRGRERDNAEAIRQRLAEARPS